MVLPNNTLLQGGRYKIVRHIDGGGFGVTYEAEHVMLHKKIAIKEFFPKSYCNREENSSQVSIGITSKTKVVEKLKKKFIEEAQSLCLFDHPNIVHVFDVFEENGTAYYVMDYIDGQSLKGLIKKNGAMSEHVAVDYIKQAAKALKYVHSKKRLHLDIKPDNIMVDKEGKAMLIDFGVSKQYDEETEENGSTLIGSTPGYAPPEQSSKDVSKFLPATDIYALGATLYKLLTGNTPPNASLLASGETLDMPSYISANTHNAIEMSMQINKMKRPQSIDEFLKLLLPEDAYNPENASDNNDENTLIEQEPIRQSKQQTEEEIRRKIEEEYRKKEELRLYEEERKRKKEEQRRKEEQRIEEEKKKADVKFGFWLWTFLVVLCYCGIASIIAPYISNISSDAVAGFLFLFGVMQTILAFYTLKAFKQRKSDAVFLGKLSLIVICLSDLFYVLSYDNGTTGMVKMAPLVRGIVTAIVWFVYLLVSKRVETVIPSISRKTLKNDYIICAVLAIFSVYFIVASQVLPTVEQAETFDSNGEAYDTLYVENEPYEYMGSESSYISYNYTGPTVNGLPEGYGLAKYPNGTYEGFFVEGYRQGRGFFKDNNEGTFEGRFDNNYYSEGTYKMKNGIYFSGTWREQQPYNGKWYSKDGKSILSEVKNGKEE